MFIIYYCMFIIFYNHSELFFHRESRRAALPSLRMATPKPRHAARPRQLLLRSETAVACPPIPELDPRAAGRRRSAGLAGSRRKDVPAGHPTGS